MRRITALTLLLFSCLLAAGQEQLTKRQLADRAFERYEYAKSLNLYLDMIGKVNYEVPVVERIADCYRLMNDDVNAEAWYSRLTNEPKASLNAVYYYAEALLHNRKFKEAKAQYKAYYQHFNAPQELQQRLATCDSAAAWMQQPVDYQVQNEKELNSDASDWGTAYTVAGLLFTSERNADDKAKNTDPRTGSRYHQLYSYQNGKIEPLQLDIAQNLNIKGKYHVGPAVLNAAGDTAYITITTEQPASRLPLDARQPGSSQRLYTRRLQLVTAVRQGDHWGQIKPFAWSNPRSYSVGQAALSSDGHLLYFTSDMPGGGGGTDIWYCERQLNGSWGQPVNCGKNINTKADEACPTLYEGTLYFASKGWPGMGGFDVFAAQGTRNRWTLPQNLRYPANSVRDDFYWATADGLSGYLSSSREGGLGSDDIYRFNFIPSARQVQQLKPPPAANDIPPALTGKPAAALTVIYYDLDRSNIRPDAAAELDKLVTLLQQHPSLRIELASYTDARAPAVYNLALSARRSAAAAAYLQQRGVASQRLILRSYGETQLVNHCPNGVPCTEEQQQLNRRTEIKEIE